MASHVNFHGEVYQNFQNKGTNAPRECLSVFSQMRKFDAQMENLREILELSISIMLIIDRLTAWNRSAMALTNTRTHIK